MMRNRGARVAAMNAGSGLLGEGPGMGAGMKRMMAGVGAGGLLGNAPNRVQQPRALLDRPEQQRGGLLERPDMRERQGYNQGGRMEQPVDPGYYDETGGGYLEEQVAYGQEYEEPNAVLYDQSSQEQYGQEQYGQEQYDGQDGGYGYNYNNQQAINQRGLLEQPRARGSLMGQPQRSHEEPAFRHEERGVRHEERGVRHEERGLRQQDLGVRQRQGVGYEERGLLEAPAEHRGLFRRPDEQRSILQQSREHQGQANRQHGLLDQPRDLHGHLDLQRDHGFESAREQLGHMERPRLDIHAEQHGLLDYPRDKQRGLMEPPSLMDMAEPPRPPMALMDVRNEPRGLMDTPVEPRGLMDTGREPISLMGQPISQRGLMDPPRERGARDQRGLLDFPGEQRGQVSPKQQRKNRPRTKQSELMEKADLQMKLLQQEKIREMEQMELLKQQQQALLMQHQQQHMQQMQQQHQIEQQLQIKQQMQQAEMIMNANKSQPRGGGIPSLLDMPTRGKTTLGKRPSGPVHSAVRGSDNKRARTGPADRRDRRPSLPGRKDTSRDRLGGRRMDRNRRGRKLSRNSSPDNKKRDRKDSGPRSSSSKKTTPSKDRGDRGRDRKNDRGKDKNDKEKKVKEEKGTAKDLPKTEVTVTMSEEYDPAEPTDDVEIKEEVKADDSSTNGKMDVGKTDEKKEDKPTDEEKDGQKQKEISLTVTVNKKGRSVNDADQKDDQKLNKEKMYKCNVCSVECYNEESFARHMNGKKHSEKMKIVMSSTSRQEVFIKSRLQAEEHLRQIEGQKKSPVKSSSIGPVGAAAPKGKALESHCKVCEKNFTGAYKDHKESPDHKAREDRSKAGCKTCKVSTFNTYQDYVKHLRSAWHLKNRKKLNSEDDDEELSELVTLDTIGFEDDANTEKKEKDKATESSIFAKPLPVGTSTPKPSMKAEPVTPVKSEEEDTAIPETYDPSLTVGQKYVVPVSGFFCKLCHKFYNNEVAAKMTHCQSEAHFDRLKKTIAAKRAKAEEKAKKMEIDQPQFEVGAQSEDKDTDTSQKSPVENGSQSSDDGTNMEDQSAYETADENQDSTVNAEDVSVDLTKDKEESIVIEDEEGESTLNETEEADDKNSSGVAVKEQRARRGGGAARGSSRGRRGRKQN